MGKGGELLGDKLVITKDNYGSLSPKSLTSHRYFQQQ